MTSAIRRRAGATLALTVALVVPSGAAPHASTADAATVALRESGPATIADADLGVANAGSTATADDSLGDPDAAVPLQVAPPVRTLKAASGRVAAAGPPLPRLGLPGTVDARPAYLGQNSCDPFTKPGAKAIAELLRGNYGAGGYGIDRLCNIGAGSEHKEGRAVDWMLNAANPSQKAVADAAAAWLTNDQGVVARRLGVMYLIWNRRVWRGYAPERGWQPYTGANPHTDHIHISLTWDGAMKRTSWWTGAAVTALDLGPCRVYDGQYAPIYLSRSLQPCAKNLPAPPSSPYPVSVYGQKGPNIAMAQRALGLAADGSFGVGTRNALLAWQVSKGLPRTGVLDKASWARLVPTTPPPPPPDPPQPPVVREVLTVPRTVVTALTPHKRVMLKVRARGASVRALQRALRLKVDGSFRTTTAAAVRSLQAASRLPVTGMTDQRTWNRVELRAYPWVGWRNVTLRAGSSGKAVVALQQALRLSADGRFGPRTTAAVIAVQRLYGLVADGVTGPRTWLAIIAKAST